MRRVVAAACAVWIAATPTAAHADPPGPTNFRTTIVAIEPAAPEIDVSIIGGDSFVELRVVAGATVAVPGYRGEPFLRFSRTGAVTENRASVTYHASRNRYGAEVPAGVTEATSPEWHQVATNGAHAWHDHRAHWMHAFDPPGRSPGDVILEATIPLVVNGRETLVTMASTWQPAPSVDAAWWGAGAGLAAAGAIVACRRSIVAVAAIVVGAGVLAAVLGWWQFRSVPPVTGPSWVAPALPTIAVAGAAVAVAGRHRLMASGTLALAAVELALWSWNRRRHVDHAIVPTGAPWWLDRAATVAIGIAAAAAVVTVVGVVAGLVVGDVAGTERTERATNR